MKILITGDFSPQKRVNDLIENGYYNKVFSNLNSYITNSEYAIINLESPIVKENVKPVIKTGPNLKCSSRSLDAIKAVGFNCVTLANNHFYDYGDIGVRDTLEYCKEIGVDYVGGGKNIQEASQVFYKQIKDKTLSIINVCEHEWSIATPKTGGSAPLNPVTNYYQIKEAKLNSDFVIVIVHGGTEHYNLPTPRMKETYRFFVDSGADVVVNHHQHCYSGYEVYNDKPIFYGLGNFCFDRGKQTSTFWNKGIMLGLTLSEKIDFELIPYIQCAEDPTINFDVDKQRFNKSIIDLNKIINDDDKLELVFKNMVETRKSSFLLFFEPYSNKYLQALRIRNLFPSLVNIQRLKTLYAIFRCEAHRDVIFKILEEEIKNKG